MALATLHAGGETPKSAAAPFLAWAGLLGVGVFVVAVAVLHGLEPRLDPVREAVSYYVHGRCGWVLTAGLVALGAGSAALTIGVARGLRRGAASVACLAAWSAGVLLGGIFPADPPGNWDRPPSTAGAIHGIAAMVALAVLPVAAILVARASRRDPRWHRSSAALVVLAAVTAACYVAFMASLAPVFVRPGPPVLLGLTERALLAAGTAWLGSVGVQLLRRA
jgi:hypothetical protein